jgi:hypothetical protein
MVKHKFSPIDNIPCMEWKVLFDEEFAAWLLEQEVGLRIEVAAHVNLSPMQDSQST